MEDCIGYKSLKNYSITDKHDMKSKNKYTSFSITKGNILVKSTYITISDTLIFQDLKTLFLKVG